MFLAVYVLGRDCHHDCAARVYFKLMLCEFGALPPVLYHCVRVLERYRGWPDAVKCDIDR